MKRVVAAAALCCLMASGTAMAESPGAARVLDDMREAVERGREAQAERDEWAARRDRLEAELVELRIQARWFETQEKRHRAYADKTRAEIERLERRREEAARLRVVLEPFLDEAVDRLEAFVAGDLPFLPEERARRIAFLRESLGDPGISLSEKLRRILEAYVVEASYGDGTELGATTLELDGLAVQGTSLRLGRLGMFFLSADGTIAARLDRESGWTPLPGDSMGDLARAIEMADRKRAHSLVALPVGVRGER